MSPPFSLKPAHVIVSTPCDNCPFRKDVHPFLRLKNVRNLWTDAILTGAHFACHKTVVFGKGEPDKSRAKACAGFLLVAEKGRVAQGLQLVQLARRLAGITLDHVRGAELVYDDPKQMIEAHRMAEEEGFPPK